MFLFCVCLIEDKYKYYNIYILYVSILDFCYNIMYLQCVLCFGLDKEKKIVAIDLVLSKKSRCAGYNNQKAVVYTI